LEIDQEAIVQAFLAESDESLGLMEEALVALEGRPDDPEILASIFRVVHTLKGNSLSLGFSVIAEVAHGVEDLLARLRDGEIKVSAGLVTLLLRVADALRQLVPAAVAGIEELLPAHSALLEQLRQGTAGEIERVTVQPESRDRRRRPGRRREDIRVLVERARTLRVDIPRLDRMLNLTGEVAIARGRLRQQLEPGGCEAVLEAFPEMERLFQDLQELIMKVRMVPVGPVFRQYIRTVRDIAVTQGKQVRVVTEGEEVEVDTTVIEHLKDPITHMVRNAIDHGIESPEVRRARGKPPLGLVALRARHDAGSIVIEVADDGSGLDREAIKRRAIERGLIGDGEKLSSTEIDRLIFEPGFTTAEDVTELSGRGVGMDVVRRNVEALRGAVKIESRPGEGTAVAIRLPLTLAIIDGFGVGVGTETYMIPLDTVVECVDLPAGTSDRGDGRGVFNLRGEGIPFVVLARHFGIPALPGARQQVVVVRSTGGLTGLVVDGLFGESQTVIKPLGTLFLGIPGIMGSALLGNGRVALILDVEGLLRQVLQEQHQEAAPVGA
jgi:two-component system chemotaxis sensor kinase CheA